MWNPDEVRRKLRNRAADAERAIAKYQGRIARDERVRATAQTTIDMSAAEADVCSKVASAALESREALLAELNVLLAHPGPGRPEVRSLERYREQFARTCEQLIRDWA
jgi:hypothetical protein